MKEIIVYLFTFALTSFLLNLFPQQKKILPIPHLSTSTSIIILDGSTSYHPSLPLYQRIYIANQRVSITAENISFIRLIKREQEMTGIIHTYSSLQFLRGVVDMRFLDGANLLRFMDKILIVPIQPEDCFGVIEKRATGETLCRMEIDSFSIVQIVLGTQQKIDQEVTTQLVDESYQNQQGNIEWGINLEPKQEQAVTHQSQAQTSVTVEQQQGFIKEEQSRLQRAHEERQAQQQQIAALQTNIPSPQSYEPQSRIIEESTQMIDHGLEQVHTADEAIADSTENEQSVKEQVEDEQWGQEDKLEQAEEHLDQVEEQEQQELVDGQQDKGNQHELPLREVYQVEQTRQEQPKQDNQTNNQQGLLSENIDELESLSADTNISQQFKAQNTQSILHIVQQPTNANNDQAEVQVQSQVQISPQDANQNEIITIPQTKEKIAPKFINEQQISSTAFEQQSISEIILTEQVQTVNQLNNMGLSQSTSESIADKIKTIQLEFISQDLQTDQNSTVDKSIQPLSDINKQQSIQQSQRNNSNTEAAVPQQVQKANNIQSSSKDDSAIELKQQRHNEQPQLTQGEYEEEQNGQPQDRIQQNQEKLSLQLVNHQILDNLPSNFLIS